MDWRLFTDTFVSEAAWPLLAAWVVWVLRDPIRELLQNMYSNKKKNIETEFSERLAKVRTEVEDDIAPISETDLIALLNQDINGEKPSISTIKDFYRIALMSPNAAVLHAWACVEGMLVELSTKHDIKPKRGRSPLYLTKMLTKKGIISLGTAKSLEELRALINTTAHAVGQRELSFDQAMEFKLLADQVTVKLSTQLES